MSEDVASGQDILPGQSAIEQGSQFLHGENDDRTDKPGGNDPNWKISCKIFTRHVVVRFLGLSLYCLDIASDVNAALGDFKEGEDAFGYLTLGLVFAPGFLFAFYMFFTAFGLYAGQLTCVKAPLWLLSAPILPVWPIVRDIWLMIIGTKATISSENRTKYLNTLNKPSRAYLLKFTEAFAESAPQLVVRLLKVSLRNEKHFSDIRTSETVQISVSLVVLALTVVSTYQKNLSTQQIINGDLENEHTDQLPCLASILAMVWWLCLIIARLEALTLFTTSFDYWIFLVIGIHVMLLFLFQTIAARKSEIKKLAIYFIGAFMFIFVYVQFNMKTRIEVSPWFPYMIFSVVIFIENSAMLTLWFYKEKETLDAHLSNLGTTLSPLSQWNGTSLSQLNGTSLSQWNGTTLSKFNGTSLSQFNGTILSPISSLNDSIMSPLSSLNGTIVSHLSGTTMSPKMDVEDLQLYWERLIFFHYGVFLLSFIFMVLTFCCASCLRDKGQSVPESNGVEMQTLNSRTQIA